MEQARDEINKMFYLHYNNNDIVEVMDIELILLTETKLDDKPMSIKLYLQILVNTLRERQLQDILASRSSTIEQKDMAIKLIYQYYERSDKVQSLIDRLPESMREEFATVAYPINGGRVCRIHTDQEKIKHLMDMYEVTITLMDTTIRDIDDARLRSQ
ncbi:hypothetical protein H4R33_005360 [Dimargaris cristalligena]|nr:hypothetical protein H4R33_005360 [Dimargaris cristalligena]